MEGGALKRLRAAILLAVLASAPVTHSSGITENGPSAATTMASSVFQQAASSTLLELVRSRAPWLTDTDLNRLASALHEASNLTGLPRELLLAVIEVESAYQIQALSAEGAIGLMQVKPIAATEVGMDADKLDDPHWNVITGALYLDRMRRTFDSLGLALAAYAAGPGNVAKGSIPRWYVRRVERRLAQILKE
jgi:soluble lytic murein transglycosylase-like protein